jgi:hypothetical protein
MSFTIADGPRQRSHSRVRDPWDSRPYFTVSDTRHPKPGLKTVFYSLTTLEDTQLNWKTEKNCPWFLCCLVFIHFSENVFIASLPCNGCYFLFHNSYFQPSCNNTTVEGLQIIRNP